MTEANKELRPYQRADVELLSQQKAIAIFNEMRTGKTPTALHIFQKGGLKNALIICPATLQIHWQKSVEEGLGHPAQIVGGLSAMEREMVYKRLGGQAEDKYGIVIVSKETFRKDSLMFKEIREGGGPTFAIIIDEGHFLRSHKTQQSKSIYTLNDIEYKMVLTGTPMVNHASDVFGILHFLKPDDFPNYDKFISEYFLVNYFRKHVKMERKDGTFGEFTLTIPKVLGYQTKEKRDKLQTLINEFSTQRTQEQTMPGLPKVEYQQVSLELNEQQRAVYDKGISAWENNNPLELLTRLKSLILGPPSTVKHRDLIDENTVVVDSNGPRQDYLTDEEKLIMKNCQGVKFDGVLDFCQKAKGQNIVVFSTRSGTFLVPLARALESKGLKVGLIMGQISLKERQRLVEGFQKKEVDVLLCNIVSAGVGLNLSQADIVIFADRAGSPADNEQAEDRFLPVREADVKPKVVIDLVAQETIDERVFELLKTKQDITRLVLENPGVLFK